MGKYRGMTESESERQNHPAYSSTTLLVEGISWRTTREHLLRFFRQHYHVTDCIIMRKSDGRSREFGFITFSHPLSQIHSGPYYMEGRRIDLKMCCPLNPLTARRSPPARLDLDGIPSHITKGDLRKYFKRFGNVKEVAIERSDPPQHISSGVLYFHDEDAVDRCVEHARHLVQVNGDYIVIEKSDTREASATTGDEEDGRDTRREESPMGGDTGMMGGATGASENLSVRGNSSPTQRHPSRKHRSVLECEATQGSHGPKMPPPQWGPNNGVPQGHFSFDRYFSTPSAHSTPKPAATQTRFLNRGVSDVYPRSVFGMDSSKDRSQDRTHHADGFRPNGFGIPSLFDPQLASVSGSYFGPPSATPLISTRKERTMTEKSLGSAEAGKEAPKRPLGHLEMSPSQWGPNNGVTQGRFRFNRYFSTPSAHSTPKPAATLTRIRDRSPFGIDSSSERLQETALDADRSHQNGVVLPGLFASPFSSVPGFSFDPPSATPLISTRKERTLAEKSLGSAKAGKGVTQGSNWWKMSPPQSGPNTGVSQGAFNFGCYFSAPSAHRTPETLLEKTLGADKACEKALKRPLGYLEMSPPQSGPDIGGPQGGFSFGRFSDPVQSSANNKTFSSPLAHRIPKTASVTPTRDRSPFGIDSSSKGLQETTLDADGELQNGVGFPGLFASPLALVPGFPFGPSSAIPLISTQKDIILMDKSLGSAKACKGVTQGPNVRKMSPPLSGTNNCGFNFGSFGDPVQSSANNKTFSSPSAHRTPETATLTSIRDRSPFGIDSSIDKSQDITHDADGSHQNGFGISTLFAPPSASVPAFNFGTPLAMPQGSTREEGDVARAGSRGGRSGRTPRVPASRSLFGDFA